MTVRRFVPVVVLGCALNGLAVSPTSAQETRPQRWAVSPQLGLYVGGTRIADGGGVVSPETEGKPVAVEMARSPMVGLALDVRLHEHVGLRGTTQATILSNAEASLNAGTEPCGSNCTRFLRASEKLGSGGVLAAAVDLVIRGPEFWMVRPYAYYGVGGRHAWYDFDDLPEGFSPRDRTRFVGHSGVGVRLRLPFGPVDLEMGNYHPHPIDLASFVRGGRFANTFASVGFGAGL